MLFTNTANIPRSGIKDCPDGRSLDSINTCWRADSEAPEGLQLNSKGQFVLWTLWLNGLPKNSLYIIFIYIYIILYQLSGIFHTWLEEVASAVPVLWSKF